MEILSDPTAKTWGWYVYLKLFLILVKRSDASLLEAQPTMGALAHPPGNSGGGRQGSWASLNMRPSDGGISIRIGLDESRVELLQDRTENNERLARTSNCIGPSSGSELHELESLEPRRELA